MESGQEQAFDRRSGGREPLARQAAYLNAEFGTVARHGGDNRAEFHAARRVSGGLPRSHRQSEEEERVIADVAEGVEQLVLWNSRFDETRGDGVGEQA